MAKIQDYDLSKQDVNVQDTHEDIKTVINLGNYEIKTCTTQYPLWSEPVSGILVLSNFGATRTLFVSNMEATNKWSGVSLTDL